MGKRRDAIGLFWEDRPKEKIIRVPPARFWESPDYLPGLQEARDFKPNLFTDQELYQAYLNKEPLLFDTESYPNYWLAAFKSLVSGKVLYFECDDQPCGLTIHVSKLKWILENFCIINFNGRKYDFPVTALALSDAGPAIMYDATQMLIEQNLQPKDVYDKYQVSPLRIDSIDLLELTALRPGLKKCAGRLHAPRLQDLPFKPGTVLTEDQISILIMYCVNDLDNTGILYKAVSPQIELREQIGKQYKMDLRSHSDAQMAEAIIANEIRRISKRKHLNRAKLQAGTKYRYQVPNFIRYESPLMNHVLGLVKDAVFAVSPDDGSVIMPPALADLVIEMGKCKYKMGIGGLHSQEKNIAHVADDKYFIADTDATSYYPFLILNAGLTPTNLGQDFISVYREIVSKRIIAKEAGDAVTAQCLKIVANGTFGKLGSMWSIMYAPNLMIQVTVTGQLSILMLAERFELAGIEVTSINTDGIVVKCLREKEELFNSIVKQWEKDTGFKTEEIRYAATYNRDINNYIAVYETPQKGKIFKTKGVYGDTSSSKNAVTEICVDAMKAMMANKIDPSITIRECKHIFKFTTMRHVSGGAVKDDKYLGQLIRWYYATGEQGEIIYAKTGNKVARTEGGKPLMDLPIEFPSDVDYNWYEVETWKMLNEIGYSK